MRQEAQLIAGPFRLPQAKVAAVKAARLAMLLKVGDHMTPLPALGPTPASRLRE
jgi:hypothetical protein